MPDGLEERRIGERRSDLLQMLQRLEEKIDAVMAGFPGDDPLGHRRYHEADIERVKARTEFFRKLFFELSKYGLLGLSGWLFMLAWRAFLKGPG